MNRMTWTKAGGNGKEMEGKKREKETYNEWMGMRRIRKRKERKRFQYEYKKTAR